MRYGRHLKLTDTAIEKFCDAISIGAAIKNACAYANISVSTYYSWIHRGEAALERLEKDNDIELEDDEKLYLKFYNSVEQAQSNAAITWLQVVNEAASTEPGYALRMLKIRFPGDYDEVQKSEVDLGGDVKEALLEKFNQNVKKIYGD